VPRYYFDVSDGDTFTKDDVGLELDGIEAARAEARKALPDIARDVLPEGGDRRTMTIRVRDEAGKVLITATLSLLIETAP
jgi:hypothetical protein